MSVKSVLTIWLLSLTVRRPLMSPTEVKMLAYRHENSESLLPFFAVNASPRKASIV